MFAFRCTKVLRKKLALPVTSDPPSPTTRLGDWYGNTLNIGHQRLMIFISERSLLPVIMPIRERSDLLQNFKRRLALLLVRLDIDAHLISAELDEMPSVNIAPTANRSVLGSLNDFINLSKHRNYYQGYFDMSETEYKLAQVPCGPIDYDFPGRKASELLSAEQV